MRTRHVMACLLALVSFSAMTGALPVQAARPSLHVALEGHGAWASDSLTTVALDVATAEPMHVTWSADASWYGGTVAGFRWGWDIFDPSNAVEWQQDWCASCPQELTTSVGASMDTTPG
jgi:hypothetical protein